MIKVAFISPQSGEIESIRIVGDDSQYLDGCVYGGQIAKHIPADSDESFIVKKYWDTNKFVDKPAKPSKHHDWQLGGWVINLQKMQIFVRELRNSLLQDADWTQIPDAPLTDAQRAEWAAYRQVLRDLPAKQSNITSIDDIIWPDKPLT
jgi:hypothetical protein